MVNQQLKGIVLKWIDAYNKHDLESILSLYDSNIINIQLPYGNPVQGYEAIRNVYINIFKAFPDIHIESENIVEQNDWVVVEWKFSGTMKGEFAGQSPNNHSFLMNGCEIFQIF